MILLSLLRTMHRPWQKLNHIFDLFFFTHSLNFLITKTSSGCLFWKFRRFLLDFKNLFYILKLFIFIAA